ncbi:hypothetical protein PVAG01_11095 [Phlyctema vagabunda]|uniref:FAD-binding domain-containing protein n=1 Tax=Phlyctema vagabunda TaxID=108571 RepID=A0ABR4P1B9_9HELO
MSAVKLNVLIVGAGVAGPCLAYWLARTRHDITIKVIERSPSPRLTGQAIDIRGAAIEIMKKMNMEEAVRSLNTTETGTEFINSSGQSFAYFESGDTFTAEYEILRADLSGLFLEATQNLSNVQYIYGDSVESLAQTGKQVDVTFTRGSKETFDLVVATDGSTSKTRPMILDQPILKDSYKFLGQYIAFFSIPSRPTDTKLWKWYNVPKGLCIMTRPHRNPGSMGAYLCITTPSHDTRDPLVEDALQKGTGDAKRILREYFENAGWEAERILAGMDQAEDFYMSPIALVKLPKWTNGNALVLGDAAHATFGIGTSLAIEGAYMLAGELSKIQSSDEVPEALVRYEDAFRPLYEKGGDPPGIFPQCAMPQTAWGLWLRDCLLWFVSKTRLFKLLPGDSVVDQPLPSFDWASPR